MSITKLDAAQREIVAAVRLFFDGGDQIAVHVLAAAARELTTTLCDKRGIKSFFFNVADQFSQHSKKELFGVWTRHVNFFKHANSDHAAVLEDFQTHDTESVLFVACHDLGLLCDVKPVEVDVFTLWFLALHFPDHLPTIASMFLLPTLNGKSHAQQVAAGKHLLEWASNMPHLLEQYSTKK